jgi:toluene monooxygenase system ferredoxin subunit
MPRSATQADPSREGAEPAANGGRSRRDSDVADWRPVLDVQDVRENEITKAEVGELSLVLLRQADDVFAYRDECPHEQHPLSKGELGDGVIVCAKHLWEFEIRTGQHITRVPRIERNLVRYPVRLVDGRVEIDLSAPTRWGE